MDVNHHTTVAWDMRSYKRLVKWNMLWYTATFLGFLDFSFTPVELNMVYALSYAVTPTWWYSEMTLQENQILCYIVCTTLDPSGGSSLK